MKNVTFERKAERTNFYTQLRIFSLHDSKVWRRQCLLEQRRSITHLSPCCYICLPSVWLSWFSPGMSHHLHSVSPFRSSCLFFSEDGWVRCMLGAPAVTGGSLTFVCSQGLVYSTMIYYSLHPPTLPYSSGSLKLLTYRITSTVYAETAGLWSELLSVLVPQKCARLKIQSAPRFAERICCTSEPD